MSPQVSGIESSNFLVINFGISSMNMHLHGVNQLKTFLKTLFSPEIGILLGDMVFTVLLM